MVSTEVERMILPKSYYLLFLATFFLLLFTVTGDTISWETEGANALLPEKAVPSSYPDDHAAFLPLSAFDSLISQGDRQLNGRLSKGKFLVASRQIRDPRFQETVILLIQHDSNGTVGLIVNRPTTVSLFDFFPEIKEQHGSEHFTYIGGPVGMNQVLLLIRIKNKHEGAQWVFDDVYVSASKAVLEKLIKNPAGEAKFRAYAGYAGWTGGQLEQEISRGDWQVVRADAETIFKKPSSEVWPDLIRETETIHIEYKGRFSSETFPL
jgi:putative transcriptional regulator